MICCALPRLDLLKHKRKKIIYESDEPICAQGCNTHNLNDILMKLQSTFKEDVVNSLTKLIELTKGNCIEFGGDEVLDGFISVIYDLLFSGDNDVSFLVIKLLNLISYQEKSVVISELIKINEFITGLMRMISENCMLQLMNMLYNILLDYNDLIFLLFKKTRDFDILINIIKDEQISDFGVKKISSKIILLIISSNIPVVNKVKSFILNNSLKVLQDNRNEFIKYYILQIIYNLIDNDQKLINYLFTKTNYIYILQKLLEPNNQKITIGALLCFGQYFQNKSSDLILFPYQKLLLLLKNNNENVVYCVLWVISLILNQKKIDFCESFNLFEIYQSIMNDCNCYCKQEILYGFSSIVKYGNDKQILKLLSLNYFFEFIADFLETEYLENIKICFFIIIKLIKNRNPKIREICHNELTSLDIHNLISRIDTKDPIISNYSHIILTSIFTKTI